MCLQGKAKGKQENSSTIANMHTLFAALGKGPLKSILKHSNSWVAFIKWLEGS